MGVVVPLTACALLAAAAMLCTAPRARAWATLLTLALAPALLASTVWDVPAVANLRDRPLLLAVLIAGGLVVVLAGARLFTARPEALAIAAAVALPFRVPLSVEGSVSNLLIPLYLVIAAGALAYALPRIFGDIDRYPRERRPRAIEWLLALALVVYAVRAAGSLDQDKAVEQAVFFYIPFALLFAQLVRLDWTLDLGGRVAAVLVALALVFAGIGFVEYASRHLLLNPKVIASNQVESYFRVNSLFFDPNIYGRFLAVVMLAVTTVLLWATRARTVAIAALVLAVLWAGLVLTLSQSSFAALLAGLAVLAALRWSARGAVAGVMGLALAAVVLVIAVPGHLGVDLSGTNQLNETTSGRYELIAGGVRLVGDRPVTGHGSGSFSRAYLRAENGSTERAVSASHTTPVTVAAEQGAVGLAVYVLLLAAALLTLLRGAGRDPVRAAVAAAFVAIVVHSMSYAAFLEDPLTWFLAAIGLACTAGAAPAPRPVVDVVPLAEG